MGKSKAAKLREVSGPSNKHTSASTWTSLADQLEGLLSIHIDEPFVDLDHLCPRSAWLVIHLDLIRPVSNIPLALDALAVLCVRSERLRLDEKLHEAYWRQMLTSGIMREPPSANSPVVSKFIRFVKHKNVRVMLSWQGKRFQSTVTSYLRSFLEASTAKYDVIADALDGSDGGQKWRVWRSLHVGIRFADSSLTRGDIKTIKVMLTSTQEDAAEAGTKVSYLCEQHTLSKLYLQGNRMGLDHLRELTMLLEDPQCRRIDDLDLEKTFPDDVSSSIDNNYVAAFQRVAKAALTAKPQTETSTYVRADAGFGISLARNMMYDGLHLKALHEALESASRPLSALSLAYTKHEQTSRSQSPSPSSSHKWLARMCMTSPTTSFTKDALLDLTLTDIDSDMDKFHGELKEVALPRLRDALEKNIALCCRVRNRSMYETPTPNTYPVGELETGSLYPVLEVLDDGWCRVPRYLNTGEEDEEEDDEEEDDEEVEDEEEDDDEENGVTVAEDEQGDASTPDVQAAAHVADPNTCWIRLASLCAVYTVDDGEPDIMSMRFSSLVCHGDNDEYGSIVAPKSDFLKSFLLTTGREIEHISLRRWHDQDRMLSVVLGHCPNLRELDLQGSKLNGDFRHSLWRRFTDSHWSKLEVINVSGAGIETRFFDLIHEALAEYVEDYEEEATVKLRYLSVLDCKINVSQVGRLRDFLKINKTLELVELDASVVPSGVEDELTPSKMALSLSLEFDNERLHSTSLAVNRKVVFACVLPKIPQFRAADIDSVVLSRCLEYAGNVTTRRVVWCDPVPLRKWFRQTP